MKDKELTEAQKLRHGAKNWIRIGAVSMLAGIFLDAAFFIFVGMAGILLGVVGIRMAQDEEDDD